MSSKPYKPFKAKATLIKNVCNTYRPTAETYYFCENIKDWRQNKLLIKYGCHSCWGRCSLHSLKWVWNHEKSDTVMAHRHSTCPIAPNVHRGV